jgi:glycosyltransferase involved in cell wall biosynthesis
VLLQGYPDLEYVIADGGSGDGSLAVIERYRDHLARFWSRPDRGQSQAINAGFAVCTGSVWGWLNSDDVYLPGTLGRVAPMLGGACRLVYGSSRFVDAAGQPLGPYPGRPLRRGWRRMRYWKGWDVPQPTLFFDARLFAEKGPLDETLRYALDYEWVVRVSRDVEATCLPETLALYRMHPSSKTGDWESRKPYFFAEMKKINQRHAPPWRPSSWGLWLSWARYYVSELARPLRARAGGILRRMREARRAS